MEIEIEVAADPASEQVETALPASEVVTPEEKPIEASKTFTQEELDLVIGKRLARERNKWERMQVQKAAEIPSAPAEVPPLENFESTEAYADALATRKAYEIIQKQDLQRQQEAFLTAYHDKEDEARDKYDDFEQVAYNPKLRITTVMAETIQASEVGPEVVYYLGSNPKEADRISHLPPFLQAKEIGRLEAKLVDSPPVKKTTSAPTPIEPVTARGGTNRVVDTTDPRSVKSMTTSEWIEADRARQIKKMEAQQKYR
ncbi:hypothetical protein UFOVP920_41 [uncultured Caudovirales phage]|uniref:Uncharacterized protein n=1 Tax=uncultured Caudovirales phage TaxID=2100421 RepID=A0A6J5S0Q9_9CAUD|nr:hypothetical protein UFOVP920_41 [uncultured Caudovirales phage]CAB4200420.1 hypothetical protein UFOVP1345_41 [uncultured Caudovirales phage]CAB5228864.1 hypothetical protein UFOVP1542_41 [uncultured Caudovirales phage]